MFNKHDDRLHHYDHHFNDEDHHLLDCDHNEFISKLRQHKPKSIGHKIF